MCAGTSSAFVAPVPRVNVAWVFADRNETVVKVLVHTHLNATGTADVGRQQLEDVKQLIRDGKVGLSLFVHQCCKPMLKKLFKAIIVWAEKLFVDGVVKVLSHSHRRFLATH